MSGWIQTIKASDGGDGDAEVECLLNPDMEKCKGTGTTKPKNTEVLAPLVCFGQNRHSSLAAVEEGRELGQVKAGFFRDLEQDGLPSDVAPLGKEGAA